MVDANFGSFGSLHHKASHSGNFDIALHQALVDIGLFAPWTLLAGMAVMSLD